MKKIAFLFVVVAMLAVSSCTTFQLTGIQVAAAESTAQVLGEFETTVKQMDLLGSPAGANLANFKADGMDAPIMAAIQAEIAKLGGDAAVDVKIVYKAEVLDIILGSVTGSILAPSTTVITGKVVKY